MTIRMMSIAAGALAAALACAPAHGFEQKTPLPDTLTLEQTHLLDSIENALNVKECCRGTLASCLNRKTPCPLAPRLHAFVKWLVVRATAPSTIFVEADKRIESLTSTRKGVIDTAGYAIAGDSRAPILIAGYVSATCPICHFVTHELYDAVTSGALAGKARLMVKPLGNGFANRSLVAANSMGRFWDFFIALAKTKVRVSEELIYIVADSLGMSHGEFKRKISAPETDSTVKAATLEAGVNGVTLTPSYFIDRVRYGSYKDPMWLIDAAEYRYEALKKAR
ncbi:MAG TPA: thioredoxin domain-containing protein [Chitinivibrionales bacterium]|jgi:protein-disulfide isomerase|nr:thioredoxin domain-containing protein [Chitinivibrionales bacterium]